MNKEYTVDGKTTKPYKTEADEEHTGTAAGLLTGWFTSPVLPNATLG